MTIRPLAVLGAPSSLGIRPYDDGEARHLDRAPGVLRERGLVTRLGAIDLGDVAPPSYRDYARPPNGSRNQAEVIAYSRSLRDRVAAAIHHGRFGVVVGGDCSIVLGCLLGARRAVNGPVGLIYVDAHADFATPEESQTGAVAGMSLALALGHGDTPLARLGGRTPLVDVRHVALIGRRDRGGAWSASSPLLDLSDHEWTLDTSGELAVAALARVAMPEVAGFWIHLDVDVLNPSVMPAVDSPEPGGPMTDELMSLLAPLVQHPRALGLNVSIYDPALDSDRACARRLVYLLETLLVPGKTSISR
jgi:arginase